MLVNEAGDLELHPYHQIEDIASKSSDIRAFIFNRNNKPWVVYWHISGEGSIKLPVNADKIVLYDRVKLESHLAGGVIRFSDGSERIKRTKEEWALLIKDVFTKCFTLLKPGFSKAVESSRKARQLGSL